MPRISNRCLSTSCIILVSGVLYIHKTLNGINVNLERTTKGPFVYNITERPRFLGASSQPFFFVCFIILTVIFVTRVYMAGFIHLKPLPAFWCCALWTMHLSLFIAFMWSRALLKRHSIIQNHLTTFLFIDRPRSIGNCFEISYRPIIDICFNSNMNCLNFMSASTCILSLYKPYHPSMS